MGLVASPRHFRPIFPSFIDWARALGLDTGLAHGFDAGLYASYPGSGQLWRDQVGSMHMNLGATSGATTDDPTFNGTAGRLSGAEYFGFDGGDFFRAAAANPASVNAFHHDGATFTLATWFYWNSTNVAGTALFSTGAFGVGPGINFFVNNTHPQVQVFRAGGNLALSKVADNTLATGWYLIAVSIDEAGGAGGGFHFLNGAYNPVSAADTWDPAYTTPDAADAVNAAEIAAAGGGVPSPSGTRCAGFLAWSRALSLTELDAFFEATRGRMGV